MFNVYVFQTEEDDRDELLLRYNIGGIHLAPSAFVKLQQEISLERRDLPLDILGETEPVTLYAGLVPDRFRYVPQDHCPRRARVHH